MFSTVLEQGKEKEAAAETEPNGELKVDDRTQMTIFEINLKDKRFVVATEPQWVSLAEVLAGSVLAHFCSVSYNLIYMSCACVFFVTFLQVPW